MNSRLLHTVSSAAYVALIVVALLWEGWFAPAPNAPPGLWLIVKCAPLLIPLFGVLHARRRALLGAALFVMLYFSEGVSVIYLHRGEALSWAAPLAWAVAQTMLALVFIFAAGLLIRQLASRVA